METGIVTFTGRFPDDAHDVIIGYLNASVEHVEELAPGGVLEVTFKRGYDSNDAYIVLYDMVFDLEEAGLRVDDYYVK